MRLMNRCVGAFAAAMCFAIAGSADAQTTIAEAITFRLADEVNVNSFTINGGGATVAASGNFVEFTSPADGFGYAAIDGGFDGVDFTTGEDEGDVDEDSPFNWINDQTFATDSRGIIVRGVDSASTDFGNFFGSNDTVNGDTTGPLTATWVFDISSATGTIGVDFDLAAQGDFEDPEDIVRFEYAFGADPFTDFLTAVADEDAVGTYTGFPTGDNMEDDPLVVDGVQLTNTFQTFSSVLGSTTESTLSIRYTAETDGGNESVVFRNLDIIDGAVAPPEIVGDFNGDSVVNAADYTLYRDSFETGSLLMNGIAGPDRQAVGQDLLDWAGNYLGSAVVPSATATPEPGSAVLLLIGLAAVGVRRNG